MKEKQKPEQEDSEDERFDRANSIEQALITVIDHRMVLDIQSFAKNNLIELKAEDDAAESQLSQDEDYDLSLDLT